MSGMVFPFTDFRVGSDNRCRFEIGDSSGTRRPGMVFAFADFRVGSDNRCRFEIGDSLGTRRLGIFRKNVILQAFF
jgi:hypothetical protein